MENRMQIFQNEEFGRIRTFVTEDGIPWFVGKDVADNLGYQNGSRDINRHVAPEDRTKGMVFDGNQRKETILINESGLYSLILSSKLESAKRFKHWVTSEVLPSIRRHGAYMTDALLEQAAGNADVAAQVVRALSEERNLNKKLAGQLKQAEAQLTVALPKAAYFDALVDCPDCTGIRLTAKELGVPQSMFTAYQNKREQLYNDYVDGILSAGDYIKLKTRFDTAYQEQSSRLNQLSVELARLNRIYDRTRCCCMRKRR